MPGEPVEFPGRAVNESPESPGPPAHQSLAAFLTSPLGSRIADRLEERLGKGGWSSGAIAGGIVAAALVFAHDRFGNVNVEALLNRQDDRIEQLEQAQDKLIKLHEHDAKMDEWRNDAMEAMARALEVELPTRPTRPAVIPSPRQ